MNLNHTMRSEMTKGPAGIRLQRVLAEAGVASRRACEELIAAGRVAVNGSTVQTQGVRVDPARDAISVDGVPIPTRPGLVHLAVNKPRGVLTTMHDPAGRPCPTRGDAAGTHSSLERNRGARALRRYHPESVRRLIDKALKRCILVLATGAVSSAAIEVDKSASRSQPWPCLVTCGNSPGT